MHELVSIIEPLPREPISDPKLQRAALVDLPQTLMKAANSVYLKVSELVADLPADVFAMLLCVVATSFQVEKRWEVCPGALAVLPGRKHPMAVTYALLESRGLIFTFSTVLARAEALVPKSSFAMPPILQRQDFLTAKPGLMATVDLICSDFLPAARTEMGAAIKTLWARGDMLLDMPWEKTEEQGRDLEVALTHKLFLGYKLQLLVTAMGCRYSCRGCLSLISLTYG